MKKQTILAILISVFTIFGCNNDDFNGVEHERFVLDEPTEEGEIHSILGEDGSIITRNNKESLYVFNLSFFTASILPEFNVTKVIVKTNVTTADGNNMDLLVKEIETYNYENIETFEVLDISNDNGTIDILNYIEYSIFTTNDEITIYRQNVI